MCSDQGLRFELNLLILLITAGPASIAHSLFDLPDRLCDSTQPTLPIHGISVYEECRSTQMTLDANYIPIDNMPARPSFLPIERPSPVFNRNGTTALLKSYHRPTSPRSLVRHAICALFAASASKLKSFRYGAVSGAPPPSPLWPRYAPATVCPPGIRCCCCCCA